MLVIVILNHCADNSHTTFVFFTTGIVDSEGTVEIDLPSDTTEKLRDLFLREDQDHGVRGTGKQSIHSSESPSSLFYPKGLSHLQKRLSNETIDEVKFLKVSSILIDLLFVDPVA